MTNQLVEKKIIIHFTDGQPPISCIYLKDSLKKLKVGESVKQISISKYRTENMEDFPGEIILDLDKDGKIISIEIIGDVIPKELIN